jgi:hypothetical protein
MINIQEIRIGNIVCLNESSPAKNEFIGKHHKWEFSDFQYPNYYSSVPLTEEILLKCGFTKKEDPENFWLELRYRHLVYSTDESVSCGFVSLNVGGITVQSVNYLHKLQNLYRFTSGRELEINI